MSAFYLVKYISFASDIEWSHITDLDIRTVDGRNYLLSSTRYDGSLTSWSIDGSKLARLDVATFNGGDRVGGTGSLMNTSGGILTGGGENGALQIQQVQSDGTFGAVTTLADLPDNVFGLQHGVTLTFENDAQTVYGALSDASGIAQLNFDGSGSLLGNQITQTGRVSALAAADIGQQQMVFSVDLQNELTSWVSANGNTLSVAQKMDADDGLWIEAPTALEVTFVNDRAYLILAAAGSSTLSVIEVSNEGSLIIRDHLLDDLLTRFAGVTAMTVVIHQEQTFVIAGGTDDGISIFLMLPGGQLIAKAHLEDTTAMALENVSTIAARSGDSGIDIYVASSSEIGVTQLRFDTGVTGATLTAAASGATIDGSAGNDIIQGLDGDETLLGNQGDDIIRDFAGSDTMTGGTGADIFLLSYDNTLDTITDFTVGEDQIDLSAWPMLRDTSQLTMTLQPYGMDILYGEEKLVVRTHNGEMLDYRTLQTSDLIGGTHVFDISVPGHPGPGAPTPDPTPSPPAEEPISPEGENSLASILSVFVTAALENMQQALSRSSSNSNPTQNNALLANFGSTHEDLLEGGEGDDLMIGHAGDDIILGGGGNDFINGGAHHDRLNGEGGTDIVYGGSGNDTLSGGEGDDLLVGGTGADTFVFNDGVDIIVDFEQGVDQIHLSANLWTGLASAADVLAIYGTYDGQQATLDLGNGNIIHIQNVIDYSTLSESMALLI